MNLDYFRHHADGVEMTWDNGSPRIGKIFSDEYARTFGAPRKEGEPLTERDRAPLTGAPRCPECDGRMWDNRTSKRNSKAPDFKCRDRACRGALWPGQHHAAMPIVATRSQDAARAEEQAVTVVDTVRLDLVDVFNEMARGLESVLLND